MRRARSAESFKAFSSTFGGGLKRLWLAFAVGAISCVLIETTFKPLQAQNAPAVPIAVASSPARPASTVTRAAVQQVIHARLRDAALGRPLQPATICVSSRWPQSDASTQPARAGWQLARACRPVRPTRWRRSRIYSFIQIFQIDRLFHQSQAPLDR